MTTYQLPDGSRVYDIDESDLIYRANMWFARITVRGRVNMVQYVKVKPETLPPAFKVALQLERDIEQARKEWRWPHVYVTPESIGKVKNPREWVEGIEADMTTGIRVCIRPPELRYYGKAA